MELGRTVPGFRARHDPSPLSAALFDRAQAVVQSGIPRSLSTLWLTALGALFERYDIGLRPHVVHPASPGQVRTGTKSDPAPGWRDWAAWLWTTVMHPRPRAAVLQAVRAG